MKYKSIHVIGCGVLKLDIPAIAEDLGIDISEEYLEGGLHSVPRELHQRVQESIDEATASGAVEKIIIGYGVCGRGTVGLRARSVPLFIPKAHDCIALFLGSNKRYREEFAQVPGTYYISAGWFEENVQPHGKKLFPAKSKEEALRNMSFEQFEKKYGRENAKAITSFYDSWKKNYQRVVFIDTGVGEKETYESYANDLAREFNWDYRRFEGRRELLEKLLRSAVSSAPGYEYSDDILYVPADHITEFDPVSSSFMAVPEWKAHETKQNGSHTATLESTSSDQTDDRRRIKRRKGLGIDAGGTYTDVAIYDFDNKQVLSKGKAETTRWDFTVGIENAIDELDEELLSHIDLVSVSTTLATNAIVEGHGQKVGLLLMPSSVLDKERIENRPTAVIKGRLTISGKEQQPIDPEEIKQVVTTMQERDGVSVFAVSGYGGSVNPMHELAVKDLIIGETGLYVCCGHELSDLLNFYVRANTAVLNARIIPLLEAFIADVERSLEKRGIDVPVMVVKGDGSLMSTELARYRPIETILSGPAASIAGARYLTETSNATVIDVGGTTSDIGCVKEGTVEVCPQGASVGGWRTHVKALDMSTVGLGGDSAINVEEQQISIGPKRIAPIAWLGNEKKLDDALEYLEENLGYYLTTTKPLQFFHLTGTGKGLQWSAEEQRIIDTLEKGPCSILELAERVESGHWMMLHTKRLEEQYVIQRCGLTPTDLLHVQGKLTLWDWAVSRRLAELMCARAGKSLKEFMDIVFDKITHTITEELIKKQLGIDTGNEEKNRQGPWRPLLENILEEGSDKISLKASFHHPIIGLGAPVHYFLDDLPHKIEGEIIIPEHAEVANAIGAITSSVTVSKRVSIVPTAEGEYAVHGLPSEERFNEFEEANSYATEQVRTEITGLARKAGTSEDKIELHVDDRITRTADGTELFLERIIEAEITGIPDLVR